MADFLAKFSAETFAEIISAMREKIKSTASWGGLNKIKRFFTRGGLFPAFFMVPLFIPGSWRVRSRKRSGEVRWEGRLNHDAMLRFIG